MGACGSKMIVKKRMLAPPLNEPCLADVPEALIFEIISYLEIKEIQFLSSTNKKLNKDVGLSVICPKLEEIDSFSWYRNVVGFIPKCGPQIPHLFGVQTHSICFRCNFVDQGWGDRKGQLYIVASNREDEFCDPLDGFGSREVVASSPVAQHNATTISMTFQPKSHKKYHLWYKVGGGVCHALYVSNASVFYFVQGDSEEVSKRTVSFLQSIELWDKQSNYLNYKILRNTVSTIIASLKENILLGIKSDPSIAALFQMQSMCCSNTASLETLHLVLANICNYNEGDCCIEESSHRDLGERKKLVKMTKDDKPTIKLHPGIHLFSKKVWGKNGTECIPKRGPQIPNLFGEQTDVIHLHFDFAVEGFGNVIPQIYIVADKQGDAYCPLGGFQNQKVVAYSPGAENQMKHVILKVQPELNETYHMWYVVGGGGGGHSLCVSNAEIVYSIRKEYARPYNLERAVTFLHAVGLWKLPTLRTSEVFHRAMVAAVAHSVRRSILNGRKPNTVLVEFFQLYGMLDVDEASLKGVDFLFQNLSKYSSAEDCTPGRRRARRRRIRSTNCW